MQLARGSWRPGTHKLWLNSVRKRGLYIYAQVAGNVTDVTVQPCTSAMFAVLKELYHKPVQCIQWQKSQRSRCYGYRGRWLLKPYSVLEHSHPNKHYALSIAKASTQGPTGVDDPSWLRAGTRWFFSWITNHHERLPRQAKHQPK